MNEGGDVEVEMGTVGGQGPVEGVMRMDGFVGGEDEDEVSISDNDEQGLIDDDSCSESSQSDGDEEDEDGEDEDDEEGQGGRGGHWSISSSSSKQGRWWRHAMCRAAFSTANGAATMALLLAGVYMLGKMQGAGERFSLEFEQQSKICPAGALLVSPSGDKRPGSEFRVCISGGPRLVHAPLTAVSYVCLCLCVCRCLCRSAYVRACVCALLHVCVSVSVSVCLCVCVSVSVSMYVCMYVYISYLILIRMRVSDSHHQQLGAQWTGRCWAAALRASLLSFGWQSLVRATPWHTMISRKSFSTTRLHAMALLPPPSPSSPSSPSSPP